MVTAIVGTGLIGGSLAIALRKHEISTRIIGVESDAAHAELALEKGLVDEILPLADAIDQAGLIVLAVPVHTVARLLPVILGLLGEQQVLMDMGSTKQSIIQAIEKHPRRNRFVATHPMWGTEYSGPAAAVPGAFSGRAAVICNQEESAPDALQCVEDMYRAIGMRILYMNAGEHDLHTAYISHISHITSFALANTVLEKEKEEHTIFELASAGFESTVRLAKSNPDMWLPIFMHNRENVLDVLNEHITQLKKFKSCLEKENYEWLNDLMVHANSIKKIIG
jgi:prephenate dehydrogenase